MCVIQLAQYRAHNWHLRGGRSSLSLSSSPAPPPAPSPAPPGAPSRGVALTYLVEQARRFLNSITHSYSVLFFFSNLTEFLTWHHKITSLGNYSDTLYKIIIVLKTWIVLKKGNLKGPYQTKCYLFSMCTTCSSYCKTQQPQGLIIFFHLGNYILDCFDPTFEIHWEFQCLSWFTKWLLLCSLFSKMVQWAGKREVFIKRIPSCG